MKDSAEVLYLENQLCFPLYAASRLTTKLYAPYLKALDITYPQYLVLLVLWQHGEQSVNEIGEKLLLETNTLTPLLKRLEQKQIIARKRSAADERSVLISLTKKGLKMKDEAMDIPRSIADSLMSTDIDFERLAEFQETLNILLNTLSGSSKSEEICS
jgi:DNA-binding MarR family transcriptional regulator